MVELPKNPTKETLLILANIGVDVNKIVHIAREEQQKLGFEVIPPNFEMEQAATAYRRLYDCLTKNQHNKPLEPTGEGSAISERPE